MLPKAGSAKECSNYRTIALMSHASKILLTIILNRMKKKIEAELPDEQAGFRTGRSTVDMLCVLQIIIEKSLEWQNPVSIVFIDYRKAFDTVNHSHLFGCLLDFGFPRHIVCLLQNLYTGMSGVIRWNGSHSPEFAIKKGVRQGCILSPHLFSLYTESVMRVADVDSIGVRIGGRRLSNLRYADDTGLCAHPSEVSTLTNAVNDAGREKGLSLNLSKTKIMHIGTCTAGANDTAPTPLVVDGERIAEVSSFKYLGSWKTTNGDCSLDIRSRIAMAKERMLQLIDIWKDHNISRQLKIRIMHALVWSVLLYEYGAESWTLRKTDERRIQAAEMWCYRRLLRVSWMEKRTNDSILVELGVQRQLLARVKIRKLTYFGHTCRPSGCELVRDVMFGVVDGKRKRGRPKISFADNIVSWTGMSLHENCQLASDRDAWQSHC
eukprot:scpid39254/ scgid16723/ Retrovirus-related Pol polyprotein LINE-1; Long interspersed element-1; Reverse transcriptase; Endonuclease